MAALEETLKKLGLATARGVPQLATGFVDLAALPFTMTGMVRPEQVFGSTDYLTAKGLLPPPQQGLLSETTELLSGALNPATATKAALAKGGLLAAPIVYHGSPKVFENFDLSKVGSGQKNQAQGYGIYVSESQPYAETFARENLTGAPNVAYRTQLGGNDPLEALKRVYPNQPNDWYAEQIKKGSMKGNLYTADLPDKYLGKMIDYDVEIKNQPQVVKNIAKKLKLGEDDLGIDIINKVGRTKEGSAFLQKEGISGVKYVFDDNKFKATNYVVFDPTVLKMLNREGK